MNACSLWSQLAPGLPEPLLETLLHGTVGGMHVLDLARQALEAGEGSQNPELRALGGQLLRWAWESSVLDGDVAAQLQHLAGSLLPLELQRSVEAVTRSYHLPERLDYLIRLVQKGDREKIQAYLKAQCAKEPGNLYWLQQALGSVAYAGDWEEGRRLLDMVESTELKPVVELVRADMYFYAGDMQQAEERYGRLARTQGFWAATVGWGAALLHLGRRDKAIFQFREAVERMPWNVNLLLRLHDIEQGVDQTCEPLSGQVAVLLYTFNKAAELKNTLQALAVSLPDNARLFALDNGSNDATPQILKSWEEKLGERMQVVTLPVNVGAPAGRNWLANLPEVRRCRWLAYVDDDAPVPEDWLGRLGAAVAAYPEASVWGCKVVNARNPALMQHVDLHLCQPREVQQDPDSPNYRRKFSLSRLQHQVLGQDVFAYCRPCATVTGCVHLLRRDALELSGGFDIRFTPSQFDDLEHDLRLQLAGEQVIYQGHLAVPHFKRTGSEAAKEHRESARSLANQYKLHQMFTNEEVARLRSEQQKRLLEDLQLKVSRLFCSQR